MEHCKRFLEGTFYEFEICWVPAGTSGGETLFGVSDYLAAFALLLVIYTISDYRNKFRLSLSALPIYRMAFWVFLVVGVMKVISEFWFYYSWPILPALNNKTMIDAVLLAPCVLTIFYWVFVSFVSPPVFSRWNCRRFFEVYRRTAHNGTAEELRVALQELSRSAKYIVRSAVVPPRGNDGVWNPNKLEGTAHDFLLLMGNRRLCAEMASSSPDTAALFFREIAKQNKMGLPIGTFAKNVAVEFLSNKSSPIFHEDSGWDSGWSGYAQLYSSAIFGIPAVVSDLSRRHSSPLDVRFSIRLDWDADNWKAYTRVALLYISRVIDEAPHLLDDFSVSQIFDNCESMVDDLYKLDGADGSFYMMDEYRRLRVIVRFIRDLMKLLDEKDVQIHSKIKPRDKFRNGIHEQIAELVYKVIFSASKVRQPFWTCWDVQHNSVWTEIFPYSDTQTSRWIFRRVCRLIYDEIRRMDKWFNFKGASFLGFCLNVLGFDESRREHFRSEEAPLRLSVLSWTRKNYSRMLEKSPKVAQACLHGRITYDEKAYELVTTYDNETGKAPEEVRFKIDEI